MLIFSLKLLFIKLNIQLKLFMFWLVLSFVIFLGKYQVVKCQSSNDFK